MRWGMRFCGSATVIVRCPCLFLQTRLGHSLNSYRHPTLLSFRSMRREATSSQTAMTTRVTQKKTPPTNPPTQLKHVLTGPISLPWCGSMSPPARCSYHLPLCPPRIAVILAASSRCSCLDVKRGSRTRISDGKLYPTFPAQCIAFLLMSRNMLLYSWWSFEQFSFDQTWYERECEETCLCTPHLSLLVMPSHQVLESASFLLVWLDSEAIRCQRNARCERIQWLWRPLLPLCSCRCMAGRKTESLPWLWVAKRTAWMWRSSDTTCAPILGDRIDMALGNIKLQI